MYPPQSAIDPLTGGPEPTQRGRAGRLHRAFPDNSLQMPPAETRQKGKGKQNTGAWFDKLRQGGQPAHPNQPALPSIAELMEAPPHPLSPGFTPSQGVVTPSLSPHVGPSSLIRPPGSLSPVVHGFPSLSPSVSVVQLGQPLPAPPDRGLMPWSPGSHQVTPDERSRSYTPFNEREESDEFEADSPFSGKRSRDLSELPYWIDNPTEVFPQFSILNQQSEERQHQLGEQLTQSIESGFKNVTQDIQTGFDRLASMLVVRNTPSRAPQAHCRTPKVTTNPSRRSFSQNKKAVRKNQIVFTTLTEHHNHEERCPRTSGEAGWER